MISKQVILSGLGLAAALAIGGGCSSDPGPVTQECPVYNDDTTTSTTGGTTTSTGSGTTTSSSGAGGGGGGNTVDLPDEFEVSARLHGCSKLRYKTLGTFLTSRGVDLTPGNATPPDAGDLYSAGADAFSVPKFDSRSAEKDGHTTASAMKLFDIFIQAAPQVIANIQNPAMAPACMRSGQTFPMFDPVTGGCVEESVSCLIGQAATPDHVMLCDLILEKADPNDAADVTTKQHIAVATLLSAANTCE